MVATSKLLSTFTRRPSCASTSSGRSLRSAQTRLGMHGTAALGILCGGCMLPACGTQQMSYNKCCCLWEPGWLHKPYQGVTMRVVKRFDVISNSRSEPQEGTSSLRVASLHQATPIGVHMSCCSPERCLLRAAILGVGYPVAVLWLLAVASPQHSPCLPFVGCNWVSTESARVPLHRVMFGIVLSHLLSPKVPCMALVCPPEHVSCASEYLAAWDLFGNSILMQPY